MKLFKFPTRRKNQRGMALLIAMVVSVLLSLLVLTLASSTMNEFKRSVDFEAHEQALMAADSGFTTSRLKLTQLDWDLALAFPTTVNRYASYTMPAPGSFAARNPIQLMDARNVDFGDLPATPSGTAVVTGLLTPALGNPMGTGRYFAKITDNQDEAPLGLPDNPLVDQDHQLILRTVGLHRGAHAQQTTHGTTVKNAVSVIEGLLKLDTSFLLGAPWVVAGPDCLPRLDGNAFDIDGYDHSGMTSSAVFAGHSDALLEAHSGMGTLFDDQVNGDGIPCAVRIFSSMSPNEQDNVTGEPGAFQPQPSLNDLTGDVRTSTDRDAANIMNPDFVAEFSRRLRKYADTIYNSPTSLSGGGVQLGTPQNPEITIALDNLELSGGGSGAGILLVEGNLNISGAFSWEGLILVTGGDLDMGGASKGIIGGVFISKLEDVGQGNHDFGSPSFNIGGNSNFYYAKDRLIMALKLLPPTVISWREITDEIEP